MHRFFASGAALFLTTLAAAASGACLTGPFTAAINGVNVTMAFGCPYSAYGMDGTYAGQDPRWYNVYYLPQNAAAVGPVWKYVPGGGWGYPAAPVRATLSTTLNSPAAIVSSASGLSAGNVVAGPGIPPGTTIAGISGNALTLSANATATASNVAVTFLIATCAVSSPCKSFIQQVLSGKVRGEGTPPVAYYEVYYTKANMRLTAMPIPAGATQISVLGAFAGVWSWPQGGTYQVVVDQGLPSQETLTVTGQAPSGSYSPATLSVSPASQAHNAVTVIMGIPGFDGAGYGGTPGTYNLSFAQPASGPAWTTLPAGIYAIDATGHIPQGNVTITNPGNPGSATAMPAVSFPDGGIQAARASVFGSILSIPSTQFPANQNDIACFDAYLAQCSAGGATPGTGACAAYSAEPAPGNPMLMGNTGDSAGAQLALVDAWSGTAFLNAMTGSPGYCEWTNTNWKVVRAAPWSVPIDMASMYSGALTRAAEYGLLGVLGQAAAPKQTAAASPITYLNANSAPALLLNGSADLITSPVQVRTACQAQPSVVSCAIVPACPPQAPPIASTAPLTAGSNSLSAAAAIPGADGIYLGLDSGPNYEVVQAYNLGTPNVNIVRGQFGTTAVSHASGVAVQSPACNHELDVGTWTVPGYTLGAVTDFLTLPIPAAVSLSGDSQTGQTGWTLPNPLRVVVTTNTGAPVPGLAVTFKVTSGSAVLAAATAVTDGTGAASDQLTFGAAPGTVVVTAAVAGLPPVQFHTTAIAPPAGGGVTCTLTAAPSIASVNSATDFGGFPNFAPGSWLEVKGSNLALDTRSWTGGDFQGASAPQTLDTSGVTIDGIAGFVSYISGGQINVQAPASSTAGPVKIAVTTCAGTGAPFTVQEQAIVSGMLAPPTFNIGGKQYLAALFGDGVTFVGAPGLIPGVPLRPAQPGDSITAYGIGFGPVTPPVAPGTVAGQGNSLPGIVISFGTTPAVVTYAGLAPGAVGLYQFNITVPQVPDGDYQVNVTVGPQSVAQMLYLTVHH
jgi:uncharacterized protein (TIGR03437 family)